MTTGIDILCANPPAWKKERIGLVTNNAAVTASFTPSRQALLQHGFHLVKLFSPEHGLDAIGPDGHFMHNGTDALTGLPVISLYGEKLMPDGKDLEDIDLLLLDLPDVGSRFYTYLWTLTYVLEAAARFNKRLIIADRPNPLSGNLSLAEGPLLDEEKAGSFIGRWRMPVRHSCTLGELALYFNAVKKIGCPLEVVPCEGWQRDLLYPQWGVSFVPPSPAMNCFEAVLLYPGLCFLEATNLSEGRGTPLPFRVAAAPWLDADRVTARFNEVAAEGGTTGDRIRISSPPGSVTARDIRAESPGAPQKSTTTQDIHTEGPGAPTTFLQRNTTRARTIHLTPDTGKYAGQPCKAVMLHVTDPALFQPVKTGLLLIKLIRDLHPHEFSWAPYPTHVNNTGHGHLQLLAGQEGAEQLFDLPLPDFMENLHAFTSAGQWAQSVAPFLLYQPF